MLVAAIAYQLSVVARGVLRDPRARRLGARTRAVLAFVPAVASAQVLPDLALGASASARVCSCSCCTRSACPPGKAIGVGLLWYGMTLLVSLLGAPAFAVGHRRRAPTDDRRRRRPTPRRRHPRPRHERRRQGEPTAPRRRSRSAGASPAGGAPRRSLLYWWVEILAVVAFYVVYSSIRNLQPRQPATRRSSTRASIIRLQKSLGINHEQAIQAWALGSRPLIIAANYFYGSLHFIVTGGVMIYLYRRWTDDYPLLAQHARASPPRSRSSASRSSR